MIIDKRTLGNLMCVMIAIIILIASFTLMSNYLDDQQKLKEYKQTHCFVDPFGDGGEIEMVDYTPTWGVVVHYNISNGCLPELHYLSYNTTTDNITIDDYMVQAIGSFPIEIVV